MKSFTAPDVQALRHHTGVGMMDAKRALEACDGDFDRAVIYLREKGLAEAGRRAGRAASEGTVGYYLHQPKGYPTVGVLVELRSETDFVAKSEEFQDLAHQLALHIAGARPRWITKEDVPADELDSERDLFARQAAEEGKPEDVIPKIVEGRLAAFFRDNVLYEQDFINSDRFVGTVREMVQQLAAKMGENIGVKHFARIAVGDEE